MKKILIIEAYTDSNIGSCALVENSIYLLQKEFPNSEIVLMAHYPDAFKNRYGVPVVKDIFNYPYLKNRIFQFYWLMKTSFWMLFVYFLPIWCSKLLFHNKVKEFCWADIVVSIGAERINDKYIKNELFALYTYKLVSRLGKKMILFPSTIGPFLYIWTKKIFKNVIKNIDLIYTRDLESYNTTTGLLELNKNKVINTFDVAVFQNWESKKDELTKKYGKSIVGISVMKWIYIANKYESPFSNYNSYLQEMVKLIDLLINNYNVHITLFPTNYQINGGLGDDLSVAYEIYSLAENKADIDIIENLVSPFEFKSLLSASEINITTRMHACILSSSAYIPTISINYLFKLKEYMDSIGLSQFSIDIEDFEHSKIMEMFEKMWYEKANWSDHLKHKMDYCKNNINTSLERLKEI